VQVRELSFLTVPDTQACDVIVTEGGEAAACEVFAKELARRRSEWDVIRLAYLVPNSVAASMLRDALTREGFATRLDLVDVAPFIPLTSTWAEYSAMRSRRLQKAENLDAKRLKKAGEVRVEWLAPGTGESADRDRFLDRAIGVSTRSWKARAGNALDSTGPQAFIRRLSDLAHQRGWLSIWMLSMNDRPVAMEYHLHANGFVYALRSDFDDEFQKISPGSYLRRCLLEHFFGRGLERYYMGPGFNAHKHRWTDQAETVENLIVYGHTLVGRCLAAWETTLKPLAKRLRAG
jgi:CelD/BcsL family acetyltransferase involved in cellulose biosynthesis